MTNDITDLEQLLPEAIRIAREAGAAIESYKPQVEDNTILQVIRTDEKDHQTPVTIADFISNGHITQELQKLTPNILIASEENDVAPETGKPFWAIDPLDGTKIFLGGGTGYAVNIALTDKKGKVVLAVVHCPATNETYYTIKEALSYKKIGDQDPVIIRAERNIDRRNLTVAFDDYHGNPKLYQKARMMLMTDFNLHIPEKPTLSRVRPINLLVAEGSVDAAIKTGRDPSFRGSGGFPWDNAADSLIVKNAGSHWADLYNRYSGLAPIGTAGRNRMHGYLTLGNAALVNSIFPQHPKSPKENGAEIQLRRLNL